jgi:hypothetical protein
MDNVSGFGKITAIQRISKVPSYPHGLYHLGGRHGAFRVSLDAISRLFGRYRNAIFFIIRMMKSEIN